MYDGETRRLIIEHELALGRFSSRPLCTDHMPHFPGSESHHDFPSIDARPQTPHAAQPPANGKRMVLVMYYDPISGKSWYGSEMR